MKKTSEQIHLERERVFSFVQDFLFVKGFSPSYDEIAKYAKLAKSVVRLRLQELQAQGRLQGPPYRRARALVLPKDDSKHV